ncbi:hypothetical protein O6H91_08G095200 [Diphasiastrum complanatum]|uniref:Uncharacterized protein n=1 Tax=Diphasiastrum complanatum TaxID=34168 RepID=A0ACC2D085_DIPCM|nr:hypothetical protein O6H91_08G095200 [Diphasiastrum complanatum]
MCATPGSLGLSDVSIQLENTEYICKKNLGEGATSYVYLVHYEGKDCAVKVCKPGYMISKDQENLQRLKGIKRIPQFVTSNREINSLIVTPICERLTREALASKNMKVSLASLVDVLHAAHQRGIVNRDIWLANMMIHEENGKGMVYIVDWGYATNLGFHWSSMQALSFMPLTKCSRS